MKSISFLKPLNREETHDALSGFIMKCEGKKWSSIKANLSLLQKNELINLLSELYKLNKENKYYISARCSETCEEAIRPYRILIKKFISPEIRSGDEHIEKVKAKKAISDYWKASGDNNGKIDLMLYYIECGTEFTLTYGDIDEPFYNSLSSMFAQTVNEVKKLTKNEISKNFVYRLLKIVNDAKNIGWGYGDEVRELFNLAFCEYNL